jgi:hypothetical protein
MFNKAGKFSGGFTKVYKPSITSPTASQIVASRTPTITSSSFSKYGNITHTSTDWQISDDPDFNTIRWSSSDDTTNKTSITTADLAGGDRYVRVRYKASNGVYSDWSDAVLFTSPWASGGTGVLVSSTVFELPASAPISIESGTYRVTIWGGGGGGAAGGGNGPRQGGGAGSVSKDVTYSSPTSISFTIGAKGGYGNQNSGGGYGGSPGGGNGGNASGGVQWTGGGGGGYSSVPISGSTIIAAGGGGSGADGGGPGGPGGSGNGAGGSAGGGGNSGSPGSGSGGGGGGSNQGNQPSGGPGNGGSNGGSYTSGYSSPGTVAANRYYSTTSSYYYGDSDTNGGAKIEKIPAQVTPVVSITSNLASTSSSTAGGSSNFSITATDTANNDSVVSYQWYLSTDGGSSYSTISGATSSTLTRYSPFYYSDNGHKIKCRATVTNSVGTNYAESNVCTLTVARNYDCSGSTVTGTQSFGSGLRPSTNGSGDEQWSEWSPGHSDICSIDGNLSSFNAKGRFCNWNMELELRITRSTNGSRKHWGSQTKSGSAGSDQTFDSVRANGGGWDPESDGTPTYRLMVIDSGTQCQNGNQDIGCESGSITLNYSYKRRVYYYETRP